MQHQASGQLLCCKPLTLTRVSAPQIQKHRFTHYLATSVSGASLSNGAAGNALLDKLVRGSPLMTVTMQRLDRLLPSRWALCITIANAIASTIVLPCSYLERLGRACAGDV